MDIALALHSVLHNLEIGTVRDLHPQPLDKLIPAIISTPEQRIESEKDFENYCVAFFTSQKRLEV